eukprot:8213838-Alexandrium_andersonii.AAC.1
MQDHPQVPGCIEARQWHVLVMQDETTLNTSEHEQGLDLEGDLTGQTPESITGLLPSLMNNPSTSTSG